ncbi:type II toxin-antitoxin system Phd/YefM family antitoxin [Streptomyces sp. NPDC059863]|uniref:type II toxin-antitoxin system Phd/YefM family antitoxin n=1 Tax=unclassified Streptomyces TaxID=2593676 RepID=UPI0036522DE9
MTDTYDMAEAHANFGTLVRRTAHSRERIAITDHGHVVAVLVNPQELADLEDALALAEFQLEKARGTLKPSLWHATADRMPGPGKCLGRTP